MNAVSAQKYEHDVFNCFNLQYFTDIEVVISYFPEVRLPTKVVCCMSTI